ncbi:hypothetical protein ABZT04_31620 [Streptomyces sp. NPDC005492]|uniref:hypothetical protein n=1 Tax=Streptomyces sp. NPDC005492 TaxID=3156883 RepID=UPI0033B76439
MRSSTGSRDLRLFRDRAFTISSVLTDRLGPRTALFTAVLATILAHGHGRTAFPHAFAWATAFTVVACGVGLCLPVRVASAERPS